MLQSIVSFYTENSNKSCSELSLFPLAISFVPTYLVSDIDAWAIGIAQPATSGTVFSRDSLVQSSLTLAVDTLDAFSHFIFDATRKQVVMVDFQGTAYLFFS